MRTDFINRHRERLLARREALFAIQAHNLREQDELLREKEADFLDTGADRTTAGVLGNLAEREREELRRIDEALARIGGGTFGVCVECREEIGEGRIEALPEAVRCLDCESSIQPFV